LSTIQEADKIIVVDKGEIKEEGNHEELLEKGEFYANLYRMQYKEVLKV
jgi:ATP-binding cassette subfamily B protein